jgi:hypothetical protein
MSILPAWQHAFRNGLAPVLSTPGLVALCAALERDDSRLIQGATSSPPPLQAVLDWPVEGCCAVSLTGWLGDGLTTVGAVSEYFARLCHQADERLGEPGAVRYFLNWFDDTDRRIMRWQLLAEVNRVLAGWDLVAPAQESA